MTGQDFERSIVHGFNDYARDYNVKLIAYRHLQMRYQPQLFDVLVDSINPSLYLAIECKSIDASKDHAIYFTQHFSKTKGVHQLEREENWRELSGRTGYLAVELRNHIGKRSVCFFVPLKFVFIEYSLGRKGIPVDDISKYPSCRKVSGKYIFDDEFIESLSG